MAHIQVLVAALLTLAAASVSRTTAELSTTTGDTVNIPCLFGEGTVRNIFWYYNVSTGPQILSIVKGIVTIAAEYEDRASLQDDNSTLILRNITVADEGTYRCVVDRPGQIAVTNIETKLNVFSLRPDTLPVISPCTVAAESSSYTIHVNQSFTITCTLPNVYPVQDTELIWYQNGQRVFSTDDVTQNDDGTTDISRQIQVSEPGNFTCNTTYLTANGRENTSVSLSVEAWIIAHADVPNTPGNGMTSVEIGITIAAIVLLIVIFLAIVAFRIKRKKCWNAPGESTELNEITIEKSSTESKRVEGITVQPTFEEESSSPTQRSAGDGYHQIPQNINGDSQQDQDITTPLNSSPEPNTSTSAATTPYAASSSSTTPDTTTHVTGASSSTTNSPEKASAESSKSTEGIAENRPTKEEVDISNLLPSSIVTQGVNVNRSDQRRISDKEIVKLSKLISCDKYTDFCVALEIDITYSNNSLTKHHLNYSAACGEMLKNWSIKTGGFTQYLDKALVKADLGGLRYEYKSDVDEQPQLVQHIVDLHDK